MVHPESQDKYTPTLILWRTSNYVLVRGMWIYHNTHTQRDTTKLFYCPSVLILISDESNSLVHPESLAPPMTNERYYTPSTYDPT